MALCWLALATSALSQPIPIWAIYNHQNSDLPSDTVTIVQVGQDGALWVGTDGGLARLDKDGHWQTYTKASTNGGLPADRVRALSPRQDGALWVGTLGGGLARLDKDGHWQTYTQASTHGGLPDDRVLALSPGQGGALWVGTFGGGLARLDKDGHWQAYTKASTNGGLPNDGVWALSPGQDGALWVGTVGDGLARLDKDGHWQTYTKASTNGGLPSNSVWALSPGQDGALWVGTDGGLARLDKDEHWQTYTKASTNGGLPNDRVLALSPGQDGALWVGTDGGLARLDKDGHWQTYTKAGTNGGLLDDRVWALSLGQDGALWVGTVGDGLARLDKDGHWQTYTKAGTNGGLPNDLVWALSPGQDGALWVGIVGDGLARLDKDGHWQSYTQASTNGGLPADRVVALSPGQDGALWVGTDGGLARLDKDGHWQTYTKASTNGGLPADGVLALSPGQDSALWVGTFGGGLARLDKDGHWQTYTQASTNGGLPNDGVWALSPGPDGALWVGTFGGGLARLDKDGHWQTYTKASTNGGLPADRVVALSPGQNGALWIGTVGDGLARLDKDGHWQTYTQASTNGGLPADGVRVLSPGPDGALWVGTFGGGLARLDKDGHWQAYTKASTNGGLPSNSVWALSPGQDGALWVGTAGGLARLTPIGRKLKVIELIGRTEDVTQAEETVAVVAHDGDYLTEPWMFRYIWRSTGPNDQPGPEVETKSAIYRAVFAQDGKYRLRVIAVDRYGNRSEPQETTFNVKLPQPETFLQRVARDWPIIVSILFSLYVCAFLALLLLTGWSQWAFRVISDEAWDKKWLNAPFALLRHLKPVQVWVLRPWFQEVRRQTRTDLKYLDPRVTVSTGATGVASALLQQLQVRPRVWLQGRSGMGKSSVFYAWTRNYFAEDVTTLNEAMRRYGFILVPLAVRDYATVPPPDTNRPESWVIEAVRVQFGQFGFETNDLKLIGAMLKSGSFALALDGMNEADRDIALASFTRSFPSTRLLVTSQALPTIDQREQVQRQWEVWRLPETIEALRSELLKLWLKDDAGTRLANRIAAEGISETIASGYDLRLLADLAAEDPERAKLPADRIELYRAILARAINQDGHPLDLSNLKQLAWTMVTQRRRRIVADDQKMLGAGVLALLAAEGVRIVRPIGTEYEFRHDQMRAFLAALWLVDEMPTLPALQTAAEAAGAFGLNRRDQEELWNFTAPLLVTNDELQALWSFATNKAEERSMLLTALQAQADRRGLTLVRAAATSLEMVG